MMIYVPKEDSFLLQRNLKFYVRNKIFLDVGTGSGIQSIEAKKCEAKSILALDINEEAIKDLKKQEINTVKSNLFSNIKKEEKFDVIAFNPPYLPRDKREDKESRKITTGGKRGDEIIVKFLKQAKDHLKKEGVILLVLSSLTPRGNRDSLLKKQRMSFKVIDEEKLFFEKIQLLEIKT